MAEALTLSQRRVAFLNALTPQEAKAFFDWVVQFKQCYPSNKATFPLFAGDDAQDQIQRNRSVAVLRQLKGMMQDPATVQPPLAPVLLTHTGKHWLEWATCTMIRSNAAQVFNRLQLDVSVEKKPTVVRQAIWDALFEGVQERRPNTPSTRVQTFMAHHIGWAVRKEGGPLLDTAGRGGSVSHRCDAGECITPTHLVFTAQHRDNLARQRCPGLTLIVFNKVIIQESPCIHDSNPADVERMDTCRHITVIELTTQALAVGWLPGWIQYPQVQPQQPQAQLQRHAGQTQMTLQL